MALSGLEGGLKVPKCTRIEPRRAQWWWFGFEVVSKCLSGPESIPVEPSNGFVMVLGWSWGGLGVVLRSQSAPELLLLDPQIGFGWF